VGYHRPEARLELFRNYIEGRLSDLDFKLTDVASAFRLSDRYVRRVFEGAREKPSDFIRRRRLELAARMLRDGERTHHTILSIALDCGFNDAAYFSRCFHERFGASPRNYRKAHSAAELTARSVAGSVSRRDRRR